MLREPARRSAFARMMLGPMPEGERWAPTINCPVLVIGAGKDAHFADPLAETEMHAKQLAGQVAMVDDAGQYPHSEFPSQRSRADPAVPEASLPIVSTVQGAAHQ